MTDENTNQGGQNEGGNGDGIDRGAAGNSTVPPIKDPVQQASARLSGEAGGLPQKEMTAENPLDVLLRGATPEQLQALKMLLNATPDREPRKAGNAVILLRRFEGNFVVDIGNAVYTLRRDEFTNITSEVLMLPVKFLGGDKFEMVRWQEFMQSEQIKCEVVSRRQEPKRLIVGDPIRHRDTGRLVENAITMLDEWLTVRLPEGSPVAEVEIPVRMANA